MYTGKWGGGGGRANYLSCVRIMQWTILWLIQHVLHRMKKVGEENILQACFFFTPKHCLSSINLVEHLKYVHGNLLLTPPFF